MVTRDGRISAFEEGPAPEGLPVRLLCEDHVGTYVLPFLCLQAEGVWRNARTGEAIAGTVLGWRSVEEPSSRAPGRDLG